MKSLELPAVAAKAVSHKAAGPAGPDGATVDVGHGHPGVAYRPDIDGLRAIAVLTVILFHAEILGVTGGFVGVDVFFVISGFLITKIITTDIDSGRFTYAGFYRRRIKRIVPAFAVVAIATAAMGFFISVPSHLLDLGKSLVASAAALTNVLFWQQTGYFAGASEIKPLLHTWSLSVEEQFYFIFPIILILASRFGPRGRLAITGAIFLVSLISSQLLLHVAPASTFFLLHTRAWELMAGSILALDPRLLAARRHSAWLVAGGIAMILGSAFLYTSDTPFPGIAALLPVAGSALVIAGGGHGDAVSARFLGSAAMVWVGRISYSLYLWHWPLFAYWRYWNSRDPNAAEAVALIAAAFLLATLSFRLVEQPLRSPTILPGWKPFILTGLLAAAIAGAGFIYFRSNGLPGRFDSSMRQLLNVAGYQPSRRDECLAGPQAWRAPNQSCVYGAQAAPTVALWGDSHAFALIDALGTDLAVRNRSAAFLGYAGCPPLVGFGYAQLDNRCAEYTTDAMAYLLARPEIDTVVIHARHASYLEGNTESYGPAEAGAGEVTPTAIALPGLRGAPFPAAYEDRLRETVGRLRAAGKQVVLVTPIPEVAYDVPNTIALRRLRSEADPGFTMPFAMYRTRQRHVIPMLDRIAAELGAERVGITDLICDGERCRVTRHGKLLYYDDDHLTRYGAGLLSHRLMSVVRGGGE